MNFDKFIDDILLREIKKKKVSQKTETGQREFAKKYREKSQNRTRWVKK